MSKFMKLFLALITILVIEFILIASIYMKRINSVSKVYGIAGYNPKVPVVIVVDVPSSTMALFQNDVLLKTYMVAGGKATTPSPYGTWTVIDKGEWGDGFGGKWMGFNVPWGRYGIHGTIYPDSIGWNSSHGCVRMKNSDVEELYKIVRIGTKVIIYGGPFGNFGDSIRYITTGNIGSDVYEIQKLLKEKGYYNANPDGVYGQYMQNCIHKFQKDNKLPISNTIGRQFYIKLGVQLFE